MGWWEGMGLVTVGRFQRGLVEVTVQLEVQTVHILADADRDRLCAVQIVLGEQGRQHRMAAKVPVDLEVYHTAARFVCQLVQCRLVRRRLVQLLLGVQDLLAEPDHVQLPCCASKGRD